MKRVCNKKQPIIENFFEFIYKRQLIWYKRFILKENPPWTQDKVLQKYKIINMYRELDKCTIYLLKKLRGLDDRRTILLNIVFYRFFNRINLYEELEIQALGSINRKQANQIVYKLDHIKKQGGVIFNNAYLISSGKIGQKKHQSVMDSLLWLSENIDVLISQIDKAKTPRDSLNVLMQIPMVGPFLACEFWTDLSYFNFFKQGWSDDDFVNIGPGAKWGLEIIFRRRLTSSELNNKLYYLHKEQIKILPKIHKTINEKLSWQDIAYQKAFSNYPFLSITNIEGSLCEFRKYWNISHGSGRKKYFMQSSYLDGMI